MLLRAMSCAVLGCAVIAGCEKPEDDTRPPVPPTNIPTPTATENTAGDIGSAATDAAADATGAAESAAEAAQERAADMATTRPSDGDMAPAAGATTQPSGPAD